MKMKIGYCKWRWIEDANYSSCVLIWGRISNRNIMKYCPKCGRKIKYMNTKEFEYAKIWNK
jgi:hypothetical protein